MYEVWMKLWFKLENEDVCLSCVVIFILMTVHCVVIFASVTIIRHNEQCQLLDIKVYLVQPLLAIGYSVEYTHFKFIYHVKVNKGRSAKCRL